MKQQNRVTIGIDASNIRAGGGLVHLQQLLGGLGDEVTEQADVFVFGGPATIERLPVRAFFESLKVAPLGKGPLQRFRWLRKQGRVFLAERKCDVLFCPGGTDFTGFSPCVTMCQNLLPFDDRERSRYRWSLNYLRYHFLRRQQIKTIRRSRGAVFLSEYSRRMTMEAVGVYRGITAVIAHGLDESFRSAVRRDGALVSAPAIVVTYVSIVNRYKHQWHVVEAVARVRAQSQLPMKLVLAGPAEKSSLRRLEASIRRHDPDGHWVDYRGPVAHSELPALYDCADIGVFASSCETFGIILLENLGMGLPVACSDRSSMPEVAGDAAVYFDPEDPESLATALSRLAESAELRAEFSRRAVERAARFNWKTTARQTIEFIMAAAEMER